MLTLNSNNYMEYLPYYQLPASNSHKLQLKECNNYPLKMYNKRNSLIINKFSNTNNSKILNGNYKESFSNVKKNVNIKKSKDPFSKYTKFISKIRFNGRNQLKSVSCQSDINKNSIIIKSRDSRSHLINSIANLKQNCNAKTIDPLLGFKRNKIGKLNKSLKEVYNCYNNMQDIFKNKRTPTNSVIDDDKVLLDLELLIKSLVNKYNACQTKNDIHILDQKRKKLKNKLTIKTSISKSIQCKVHTNSKAVNINQMDLMDYYTDILIDFVSLSMSTELLKCIIYHFVEYFEKEKSYYLEQSDNIHVKFEGDCKISKNINSIKLLEKTFQKIQNLNTKISNEINKSVQIDDWKGLNLIGKYDSNSQPVVSIIQDEEKQITVNLIDSNKNSNDILNSCKKDQIDDFEIVLKYIKPIRHSNFHFKCKNESSLFDVLSCLEVTECDANKYRCNCFSIYKSEIKHVTLKEFQPIILNHSLNIQNFKIKSNESLINYRQDSELTDSKLNSDFIARRCKILGINKIHNLSAHNQSHLCNEVVNFDSNQSDSDKESSDNLQLKNMNRNQSQCENKKHFSITKNFKKSAKIILINPYSKCPNMKVLKKCNEIFEEKLIPIQNRFSSVDDLTEKYDYKTKTLFQITFCSEKYFNKNLIEIFKISIEPILENIQKLDNPFQVLSTLLDIEKKCFAIPNVNTVLHSICSNQSTKSYKRKELNIIQYSKLCNVTKNFNPITSNFEFKSQILTVRKPFPNRCGIESIYRAIFQSWAFH